MSSSASSQRQGRCDRCRILWVWSINVPLNRQVCAHCYCGPLGRATAAVRAKGSGYTAMTWEGYRP